MKILLFISDKGSVEGDSRIWAKLIHERMQLFVTEFIPYVTLLTRDMYRHSELFSRVGILWISLHFWKKCSNDSGIFPLRNEELRRHCSISTKFSNLETVANLAFEIPEGHNLLEFLLKFNSFFLCQLVTFALFGRITSNNQ